MALVERLRQDSDAFAATLSDEAADAIEALMDPFAAGRQQGLREAAEVASAWLASDYDESANTMAQSIQDDIAALIEGEGK